MATRTPPTRQHNNDPLRRRRASAAKQIPLGQRSLDDLGTPLHEIIFCVIDLETTGTSADDEICEIGAVKVQGGRRLGTFQTFVNPGRGIPPLITTLTGITQARVERAPRIDSVLPTLLEFTAGTTIVGHNVGFDIGFLDRACERTKRERFATGAIVDTLGLARRLVRSEVPNCKLGTLAMHLRLDHQPSHRALDDALCTADLLHRLLERSTHWGVTGLEELLQLPSAAAHPMAKKLELTTRLPHRRGVYLFRDSRGTTLYVGKAADLRQRVRSYFSTDERKKVGNLLARTHRIDFRTTVAAIESEMLELRLIQALQPEFNQHGRTTDGWFVRSRTDRTATRLVASQSPWSTTDDGSCSNDSVCVGPLPSRSAARELISAIEAALPNEAITIAPRTARADQVDQVDQVGRFRNALTGDPMPILSSLQRKMGSLAASQQFERAQEMRDHLQTYASFRLRQDRLRQLIAAKKMIVVVAGVEFIIDHGILTHLRPLADDGQLALDQPWREVEAAPPLDNLRAGRAPTLVQAQQMLLVATWWEREAHAARVCLVSGELASPIDIRPRLLDALSPITSARARIHGDNGGRRSRNGVLGGNRRMGGHSAITRPASRSA